MIDNIVIYTNEEILHHNNSQQNKVLFRVEQMDIYAFIAVCFCRGIYCAGVSVSRLWNKETSIPIIKELMSRNKFKKIMRFNYISVFFIIFQKLLYFCIF